MTANDIPYKSLWCKLVQNETCGIAQDIVQFVLSLTEIKDTLRCKIASSANFDCDIYFQLSDIFKSGGHVDFDIHFQLRDILTDIYFYTRDILTGISSSIQGTF